MLSVLDLIRMIDRHRWIDCMDKTSGRGGVEDLGVGVSCWIWFGTNFFIFQWKAQGRRRDTVGDRRDVNRPTPISHFPLVLCHLASLLDFSRFFIYFVFVNTNLKVWVALISPLCPMFDILKAPLIISWKIKNILSTNHQNRSFKTSSNSLNTRHKSSLVCLIINTRHKGSYLRTSRGHSPFLSPVPTSINDVRVWVVYKSVLIHSKVNRLLKCTLVVSACNICVCARVSLCWKKSLLINIISFVA